MIRENTVIQAGNLFRGVVLSMIASERDPVERKARVMIAREHGHLSDDEAEDLIVLGGLVEA